MVDSSARPFDRTTRRPSPTRWSLLSLVVASLAGLVAVLLVPTAALAQDPDPRVVRVAGGDRYETAAEVAGTFAAGVERVFLATGEDFPDALAVGPVAGREEFPVLLVERGGIPQATASALQRLEPGAITILGGEVAVGAAVERQAGQYTSGMVDRLEGPDRYATAAAIVDEYVDPGVPVVYIATGRKFADALAGGPAAVSTGGPLLLVEPGEIPPDTSTTLDRLRPGRIVVLGGTQAVSSQVFSTLRDFTDGDVVRVAGGDRYGTAAELARRVFDGTQSTVYMATGRAFPDALAGGVVAGMAGAPMVTVEPRCVPDVVFEQIDRMDPDTLVVLGGTQAVSQDAADLVTCSEVAEPRATTIQTGLQAPWDLAFTPDSRTFLTERDNGRVLERSSDGVLTEVISFPHDPAGEGGALGLTVSPDYASDGWLYAMYTTTSDQRIDRFQADGSQRQTIVEGLPHATFHDGGRIDFGPDGMLYVGMGDAGDADRAQDPGDLAGSILRYTPDGTPAPGQFGNAVWAYGLRNTQGLAWSPDATLYAAEFGPNRDDEINRIVEGGNYGWPEVTGTGGEPTYIDPLVVRQPAEASWSGADILVDGDIPDWEGDLFVAALRGQRLYRMDLDAQGDVAGVESLLVGEYGRLRHVTQAPDGSLWILTSNCGGGSCDTDRIIRLGR